MPQNTIETLSVATPYYVLMDGKNRLGPTVSDGPVGNDCLAIYGFSSKDPYFRFEQNCEIKLTPYPLVKGYLSNQIAADDSTDHDNILKLVVLDATGPNDGLLHAATMRAVLDAQENRMPEVSVSHHLSFDAQTSTYQIVDAI